MDPRRMYRVWRGEWKRNGSQLWHFLPTPGEYGFTMYVEPVTFENVDGAIREYYGLGGGSPMVITYGLPDWMLFPRGRTPPLPLTSTADLVGLIAERPWIMEMNLLVIIGAKSVAEFEFLRRRNFTVGQTTYIVDGSQTESSRETYESLVFGERLVTSARVMREIFSEEAMLMFYRVAFEMDLADRTYVPPGPAEVAHGIEVIHLNDEAEMMEFSVVPGAEVGSSSDNNLAQALVPMNAEDAPPVFWDVGLGMLNYPIVNNNGVIPGYGEEDNNFWEGLMEEAARVTAENCLGEDGGDGVNNEETNNIEIIQTDGNSSSGSTDVICSQRMVPYVPPDAVQNQAAGHEGDEGGQVNLEVNEGPANGGISSGGAAEGGTNVNEPIAERDMAVESSSEGSRTEGEIGNYGINVAVGMMFRNRDDLKHHMAMFALAEKFTYKCPKSDRNMVILECVGKTCPWRVYAARLKECDVFEIRKYVSEHTCTINERGGYQTQATAAFIGELLRTKFSGASGGPKPREIRQMMRGDHNINISYWKAWRSRELAADQGQGSCYASYANLPQYLNGLVAANPDTLAAIHTETTDGVMRFKYMFVAMGASVRGYEWMRKVIVVDGTHLKGRYSGCLLTASAQDGNYQIFPLGFAIVDSENDLSWQWFFERLADFVPDEPALVFVSDRHPSIYKALSKVFPSAGHGICVVHLKRNVRSNFKGRHLGYLVAKAARSFRLEDFERSFDEIKQTDPACASYLMDIGIHHWARSHFVGKRYNIMTSNLAESWNAVLREAREYPIIPLLDFIRGKLMNWFASRREAANKNGDILTPRIKELVTRNFEKTGGYEVIIISDGQYEVRNKLGGSFHVDLINHTCTCFEFQMLSIPCSHAIAAALDAKLEVEKLVSEAYTVKLLRNAYEGTIAPVTDFNNLSSVPEAMRVYPPMTRRPPGRPKKLRLFSRGEKILKRIRRRIACSRCRGVGHNIATCKNPI